jgi:pleckstrin homology domain-containing family G member 4
LNIKTPSHQPCGFKNCKFSNCPVSNSHAVAAIDVERRKKFDENFIKKFEDMRKNAAKNNNEITVNKSSISVNGKSNIMVNDTKTNNDVFIVGKSKEFNNNQNKTTIKINDSCFVVNHSNDLKTNSVIELNGYDKNIKVENSLQTKCDKVDINNKIRNEENSVKIYVSGNDSSSPTPSTTLSISSSSDSDRDYGTQALKAVRRRPSLPKCLKSSGKCAARNRRKTLSAVMRQCFGTIRTSTKTRAS